MSQIWAALRLKIEAMEIKEFSTKRNMQNKSFSLGMIESSISEEKALTHLIRNFEKHLYRPKLFADL